MMPGLFVAGAYSVSLSPENVSPALRRGRNDRGSSPCSRPLRSRARTFPGVLAGVDFRQGPELGVRAEDEVNAGAGPLDFARHAVTALRTRLRFRRSLASPCACRAGSRRSRWSASPALGEDAVLGLAEVCVQDAHAADQHRHFRGGQGQQLRPVHQQFLGRDSDTLAFR